MVKKIVTYTATGLFGLFVLGLIVGPQDSPVAAPTPAPKPAPAAVTAAPEPAPANRRRGEYTITRATLACLNASAWDKVIQLRANGDDVALDAHLMPLVVTGQCKLLEVGEPVFMSDSKLFKGRALVRPAGQLKEYWVAYEAVNP